MSRRGHGGDDPFQDLARSALPGLRYASSASPEQQRRTHLPLAAWRDLLERGREQARARSGGPEPSWSIELSRLFDALESDEPAGRTRAAADARQILEGLDLSPRSQASAGEVPPASGVTGEIGDGVVDRTADGIAKRIVAPLTGAPAGSPKPAAAQSAGDQSSVADVARYRSCAGRSLTEVAGVGPARAAELEKFGLLTVEDLLYHLPFRYEDRRATSTLRDLRPGETGSVVVTIERAEDGTLGKQGRRVFRAVAGDESGQIELVWFHQMRFLRGRLKPESRWRIHGRCDIGYRGERRMVHPEIEPISDAGDALSEAGAGEAGEPRVLPIYEKPTAMHPGLMRRIVRAAVRDYARLVPTVTPPAIRRRYQLRDMSDALRCVHEPTAEEGLVALNELRSTAHRAIVFDELFLVQLGLLRRKAEVAKQVGIALAPSRALRGELLAALPFEPTGAQLRAIRDIDADLARPHPMHRLLQGDVGSGKTLVAVAAATAAIESGWQAAIMAPTELLAEQHWQTAHQVAGRLGVPIWRLTGDSSVAERRSVLAQLERGDAGLVVGTHALIQAEVRFARLALAVIDEQHRFGVLQRAALMQGDGGVPHVLLMTATPIPRTLALSLYGDLDLSFLDEMPPGRQVIDTAVFPTAKRRQVYDVVRREVAAGRQAYVVFPLIAESETLDLRDATSAAEELAADELAGLRLALVHGRMPGAERDAAMRSFKDGLLDVLVSTTVIEVGIDVPNATVMVIENAERFGLAQLHQLRGRVGRGREKSYCLLVADYRRSTEARERLRVIVRERDGLRIAEADLAIRGPGALLGTRQAGLPDFRVANILRDAQVLRDARAAAEEILSVDRELERPEHAALAQMLELRWAGRLGLARVG